MKLAIRHRIAQAGHFFLIHFPSEQVGALQGRRLRRSRKGQRDKLRPFADKFMAAYVLTDGAVIEALHQAAERGVKVRVWRDANMAAKVGDLDVGSQLGKEPLGVELRSSRPSGELMHLKGYCIDNRLLRTGSANFSRSGETRQDNDLVALRAPSVCAAFEAKFERAWGAP
jgi:phosphatidylserine/phosphatidylglycerophosphate/cardiolipin synthase-like enzyme